ncbi:MAG: molybdopterin converting factor subunit 1 [Nitrospinota bacterium]|nr:molybdopterin converting factor subunit 1 [Nitrospinota bacterium]MDP7349777.1 molybdopterin converting factor subunit 1 [Nitrospinota bacterium]HJN02346.1 molybdopterin converting factor subunit 1 [Nitrospinota bacterium]
MKVKVLYFASIKDKLGKDEEEFELEDDVTLQSLLNRLKLENNILAKFLEAHSFLFAVNEEIANLDTILKPNDEIAILPPLSGG